MYLSCNFQKEKGVRFLDNSAIYISIPWIISKQIKK